MVENIESPTEILKKEHNVILLVLGVLEKLMDLGKQGELNCDDLEKCVKFFGLYADSCHHGKEEDILFPELESKGIPNENGPIGMMIYEHKIARSLIKDMKESLKLLKEGNVEARDSFFRAGYSYIELLREHIGKEDECLFSMADNVMDSNSCRKVCQDYSRACKEFDGHTKEQLGEMAESLYKKHS
jgi:hemerythrin-like domain-containing protein